MSAVLEALLEPWTHAYFVKGVVGGSIIAVACAAVLVVMGGIYSKGFGNWIGRSRIDVTQHGLHLFARGIMERIKVLVARVR